MPPSRPGRDQFRAALQEQRRRVGRSAVAAEWRKSRGNIKTRTLKNEGSGTRWKKS
jgi:hypothetical protein